MIVEVKQGKLEGVQNQSVYSGKKFYSFSGIPYAEPPVGDLRFRPPVPYGNWEGIRDAKTEGKACIQEKRKGRCTGSEDCLYLNVHTPELPPVKAPKPVIVYIHGGGFQSGSGSRDTFGPDYLIDYDVLVVTLNYRLHILGFLNMNVADCPGNAGLKDQLLALKWIKENIRQFGGDSENITLVGESAGSVCVHYHTLSPLSKGLFKRVVMLSGNAVCRWAFDPKPTDVGFGMAKKLGLETEDPEAVVGFLKEQPAENLIKHLSELSADVKKEKPTKFFFLCVPSKELAGEEKFVTDVPKVMMQNITPVPIITGLNSKEGIIKLAGLKEDFLKQLNDDFTLLIKDNFECDQLSLAVIASKLRKYYFEDKIICMDTLDQFVDLYTNFVFYNYYSAIDYIVRANDPVPVYEYEFGFDGKFNTFKMNLPIAKNIAGASHSDGLGYLFYPKKNFPSPQFEEPETIVIRNMCRLWTNFAKTGNPNPVDDGGSIEWRPSTETNCFLRISDSMELVEGKVFAERFAFWEELLKDAK